MSIPMTGQTLGASTSTTRGRGWLLLGLVALAGVSWIGRNNRSPHILISSFDKLANLHGSTRVALASEGLPGRSSSDSDRKATVAASPPRAEEANRTRTPDGLREAVTTKDRAPGSRLPANDSPIARALRTVAECKARCDRVRDYTCTFSKRERISGTLSSPHLLSMKVRSHPRSIYIKFQQPSAG